MLSYLMKIKARSDAVLSLFTEIMEGSNGIWPSQKQPGTQHSLLAWATSIPANLSSIPKLDRSTAIISTSPNSNLELASSGQNPGGDSDWPGQDPAVLPPGTKWNPATGLNVPYNLNLIKGIYNKMMITVMGLVKPNAKQFTVNFLRGNDIALHLNSRFHDGGKQAVVRNSKVGEHWGKEERHTQGGGFPFMAGQSFEMKIMVTPEEFKVAVNGSQLFEFKHRVRELNQIDRINILHDVILTYVNVDTMP
ncbi:hypothetical protein DPEC_G00089450 [Dallia pectoralis]|uniref:Uncharacterized protein n=1 Tax=Dallia pectoralis TaxID=75939 RepID=A0ACC2H0C1_DALPE|nr:hypothetical protein DPEC_G00089450 [Dallia pectoralis]